MINIKITSNGFRWQVNSNNSCIDLITGITWLPKEPGIFTYDQAVAKFGNRLPTREQFEMAIEHNITEVFNDFKHAWFWTRTSHSSSFAYNFASYDKNIYYFLKHYKYSIRTINI